MLPVSRFSRIVLVFAAAVAVAGAGVYAFASGGGGDNSASANPDQAQTPFGGTPLPDLPGVPTTQAGTGPIGPDRPDVGSQAPDFALTDAHDTSVIHRLSDYAGKPIVVNWYASWCGPCRRELPEFEAANQALKGQVTFLGVNLLEDQGAATGILDEFGVTYTAMLDPSGAVSDRWRITQMPTTYFIAADGKVAARHVGQLSAQDLADQLAAVGINYSPAGGD